MQTHTTEEQRPCAAAAAPNRITSYRDKIGILSEREAAEMLGIKPRTLQNWRLNGKPHPPVTMVGRKPRFTVDGIQQWMIACAKVSA